MAGQPVTESSTMVNLTATAAITTIPAQLLGFYVNSTTSGTIVLKDGGTSGVAVCGTITPAIGFHAFPGVFTKSIHATIGGTLDVTFFYQ